MHKEKKRRTVERIMKRLILRDEKLVSEYLDFSNYFCLINTSRRGAGKQKATLTNNGMVGV